MIMTRPLNPSDRDHLSGCELDKLITTDLDGNGEQIHSAPEQGWTHDALEGLTDELNNSYPQGWNAYLRGQDNWVGSSEV